MVEPVVQAKRRRKAREEIHWHEGIPFASSALPTSLAMQLRTIVSEGEGLGLKTTRPSQRGLIFGWGLCARWGTNYKGTEELRSKVLKLQEESLQSDAVAALKSLALPLPLPETGSQQFFSRNYSPVNRLGVRLRYAGVLHHRRGKRLNEARAPLLDVQHRLPPCPRVLLKRRAKTQRAPEANLLRRPQ